MILGKPQNVRYPLVPHEVMSEWVSADREKKGRLKSASKRQSGCRQVTNRTIRYFLDIGLKILYDSSI